MLIRKIKCKKEEVLVSSTGVIGEIFNPNLIINPIKVVEKSIPTEFEDMYPFLSKEELKENDYENFKNKYK